MMKSQKSGCPPSGCKSQNEKGVALYFALMIMTVLLALALGISAILLGQMKVMKGMENSVLAFYAADTGIEMELYRVSKTEYEPPPNLYCGFLDLDDDGGDVTNCSATAIDCTDQDDACYKVTVGAVTQSIGVYRKVRRAIEISF